MSTTEGLQEVELGAIAPWPNLNPRKRFDDAELAELAQSIREKGLIQPPAVSPAGAAATNGTRYWLFAGERRLRAAALAGLERIPVIVRDIDEPTAHRLAGIENLDRSNLTAIEEAEWLQRELELTGVTQSVLADELGRTQSWISNRLRLLELPREARELVEDGVVSSTTARDLLLGLVHLREKERTRVFGAVAKALRDEADDGGPVPQSEASRIVSFSLVGGSRPIAERMNSWVSANVSGRYVPAEVSKKEIDSFVEEHTDLCFKLGSRGLYTVAKKPWKALQDEKLQAAAKRDRSNSAGPKKSAAKDPKLGPKKKPTTLGRLHGRFGYDRVVPLSELLDVGDVEPSRVALARFSKSDYVDGKYVSEQVVEPVYVGPDAQKRKRLRNEAVKAEISRQQERARKRVAKKAGSLDAASLSFALVAMAVNSTRYRSDALGMLRAAGHDAPEAWDDHWRFHDLTELGLSDAEIEHFAQVLAAIMIHQPDRDDARDKAREKAEDLVATRAARALEAWMAEHGPDEVPS